MEQLYDNFYKHSGMPNKNANGIEPTIIEYKGLGTIAIDNLSQAIWEDIKLLKDRYRINYVTNTRLIIPATNEYGEPVYIRHPDGRIARKLHCSYYTPACTEYKL